MSKLASQISNLGIRLMENVSLAQYTTIKVGGPAKYFLETDNSRKLVEVLKLLDNAGEKYFILGKGSNIVISDKGLDCYVIYNTSSSFEIQGEYERAPQTKVIKPRYDNVLGEGNKSKPVKVIAESGIRLQYLMNKLFEKDVVGLEYFNGIPCSLGGAIYMNLHGGSKFISEYIVSAQLYSNGRVYTADNDYFQFDYDYSILHQTKEIVIKAELALPQGNGALAKKEAAAWAKTKSIQPKDSAGCVFKNLSPIQKEEHNLPSTSIGYIIDKILGMKGLTVGGARISPMHAAFIENYNNATANDVYKLYDIIKREAKNKLNLELESEIEFVGEF